MPCKNIEDCRKHWAIRISATNSFKITQLSQSHPMLESSIDFDTQNIKIGISTEQVKWLIIEIDNYAIDCYLNYPEHQEEMDNNFITNLEKRLKHNPSNNKWLITQETFLFKEALRAK